jgi:hypothetical protein
MKSDNQRILGGGLMKAVTLYNATGTSKTGRARITATTLQVSPQGQAINQRKWSIAFHIDDFSDITGASENYEGWRGEFLNSQGETVNGRFINQFVDKTFGQVTTNLTVDEGS